MLSLTHATLMPYLRDEAFTELRDDAAFQRVRNGGYFIE